jgi:GT2 family glycosyltransferase
MDVLLPHLSRRRLIARTLYHGLWRSRLASFRSRLSQVLHRAILVMTEQPRTIDRTPWASADAEDATIGRSVEVIIVTYNSKEIIESCIRSAFDSNCETFRLRVTVVDNASSDGTMEVLEGLAEEFANLQVLSNRRNVGFGRAINGAAQMTSKDFIFCLNPDAILNPNTLDIVLSDAISSMPDGFRMWECRQTPYEHPKLYDPVTRDTEWASGACLLAHTKTFLDVGGFDGNIFLYAEDVELSWRVRASGFRIRYVPDATLEHLTYERAGDTKPSQFYNGLVSNLILRIKYGGISELNLFALGLMLQMLCPPQLPSPRWNMLKHFGLAVPNLTLASWTRIRGVLRRSPSVARFVGFDYELSRTGPFYHVTDFRDGPLVSVVIRTMDRPQYLREALQSVANQTYTNIEVVVVEDGPAKSQRIVNEYPHLTIHYFATGNRTGRCRAGNTGLAKANGKYICFLDDDDLFYADHFETLVHVLQNSPNRAAYSCGLEVATEVLSDEPFQYRETRHEVVHQHDYDRKLLRHKNLMPINTVLFERSCYEEAGGFDENLDLLEDWNLWVRYSALTEYTFVRKTTCLYRVPADPDVTRLRHQQLTDAYDEVCLANAAALDQLQSVRDRVAA